MRWQTTPTHDSDGVECDGAGGVVVGSVGGRGMGNGEGVRRKGRERVWRREYLVLVLVALVC